MTTGNNALYYAAKKGHIGIVRLLVNTPQANALAASSNKCGAW